MYCPKCDRLVQARHLTEPCPLCGDRGPLLPHRPPATKPRRTRSPARRKRVPGKILFGKRAKRPTH